MYIKSEPLALNLWKSVRICGLLNHAQATDFSFVHRFAQIITDFLISKDIMIITVFYFWHGNPRLFFKRHGFSSALIVYPRHFVITACFASSRLSLLCGNEPCLYFSIALSKYSLYPSRSLAVSFLKAASIRA